MKSIHHRLDRMKLLRGLALGLAWVAAGVGSFAADTDIATGPLGTSSSTAVKPNLMFTLDDSGSMGSSYLPDDISDTGTYGYLSSQCNGVAYDPSITYLLPVDSSGVAVAAGSLSVANLNTNVFSRIRSITSGAPTIGTGPVTVTVGGTRNYTVGQEVMLYDSVTLTSWMLGTVTAWNSISRVLVIDVTATAGSGTLANVQLGTGDARSAYYKYTGVEAKLGWTYDTNGVITSTNFYKQCMSQVGSTPGSGVFTKTFVSATSGPASSPDERQNYANWYAYYSTRMDMMKSSVSLAFKNIDSKYRVGFNVISNTSVTGSNFLDIADFGSTQKSSFYTKLNAATPGNSTPLRGALSKIGQYFAKKRSGQTFDPVQYSCQKNFHILSTDGYWNTGDEVTNGTAATNYSSYALDNLTLVGEQDDTAARPMFDGTRGTVVTTDSWTVTDTTVTTTDQPKQQVTTQTTTTTSTTTTGWTRTNQALGSTNNSTTRSNSNFSQSCSGSAPNITCSVTVTTTSSNGSNTNTHIIIAGVTPSVYNGTFAITATGTSGGNPTTTYKLTGLSANPSLPSGSNRGTSVKTSATFGFCPSGQGTLTSTPQSGNGSTVSTSSAIVTTTATETTHDVNTKVVVTPWTDTFTTVNGVVTADPPAASGTATTTNTPAATVINANVPPAPAPVNSTTTTGPTVNQPTTWTDTGGATTSCAATAPAITPNHVGPDSTSVSTAAPVTVVGGWVNSGAATTAVVGPTTVTGTKTRSTNTTVSGGSSNSLADIAMYYYKTDLRDPSLNNCTGALGTGTDVCGNNVAPKGNDVATWQHMTTFTLGLGVNGLLKYDPNYLNQTTGDFNDLKQGTKDWSVPANGKGAENIDDLWHAAVNGRGQYFSAGDPNSLSTSLNTALAAIAERLGSASGAAASNLQPVSGDNKLFVAQYVTGKWTGDVLALTIDPVSGVIASTPLWSAKTELDARVAGVTPRKIYYFKSGAANNLRDFNTSNLGADGLIGNFDMVCSKSPALSQCGGYVPADLTTANTADNMVTWLRGGTNAVYRARANVLGDIVGGAPVYVSKPPFKYTENAYGSYATSQASRAGTVYVAANDGMLHAFDGNTGFENWAFMPSGVLPNLYKLADNNYSANHQYLVDGAPAIGDVWDAGANAWKTILIGGLGAGGRSYYALDITNPTSPIALWEYSNVDLGLTFGNPIITKRADGTWVVVFASGYNNNVGSGDGNGHLFVLNALTGALIKSIPTNTSAGTAVGTSTTPSGLAKINVWVDSDIDNTAKRVYGGDLLGNVWRFDIDGLVLPNGAALQLAQLRAGSPLAAQPITTQPLVAEVSQNGAKFPAVYIGTGKYLGTSDLSNTSQQSVYALKDSLSGTGMGDVRAGSTLVAQTLTTTTDASGAKIRTSTQNSVTWASQNGWYVDLPSSGERVNVDPQLLFNTLVVAANVPNTDACTVGGESFLYHFDIGTGGSSTSGSTTVGAWMGNTMIVGLSFVQLKKDGGAAGSGDTITITVDNAGNTGTSVVPEPTATGGATKRTSWREIVN